MFENLSKGHKKINGMYAVLHKKRNPGKDLYRIFPK